MKLDEILKKNRERILKICQKYGATNVRVFGSVARGDASSSSDIDLLVTFENGRTLLDQAGLQLELEKLLKCRVDVISENGINPLIKKRILMEARPL